MRLRSLYFLSLLLLLSAACGQEALPLPADGETTVRMTLRGGCMPFDATGTKASELSWNENDQIFIRASSPGFSTLSVATRQNDGSWTFSYKGSLAASTAVRCYFFQNPKKINGYEVQLSYNSVVYEDLDAQLTADGDGGVELTTYLRPKTGRIRFQENAGEPIGFSGLSWYTAFELADFSFKSATRNVSNFPTGDDSYFYGFFAEGSERQLIVNNGTLYFSRSFGETVLRAGASGYLTVPQHNRYDGWTLENPDGLDAYTPIEIPDANFRAWLLERFDTDGDGILSRLEGKNITEIEKRACVDIASLEGIEYFPNLRRLIIEGTDYDNRGLLSEVDLSHNTALQDVVFRLNQLTSLNLNGLSSLTHLDVGHNQLTELDLSQHPSLEVLYAYDNRLTHLEAYHCPWLRTLNFSDNQLSAIDVSSLSRLTDFAACRNPISSLDLSHCSRLQFIDIGGTRIQETSLDFSMFESLEELRCYGLQLTRLNISGCSRLRYLNFEDNQIRTIEIPSTASLTDIICTNNQLTALDLSGVPNIHYLYCGLNQLAAIDVSGLEHLIHFHCNDNYLSSLDVSANPNLERLVCHGNRLSGALDLTANPLLIHLNTSGCPQLNEIWFSSGVQPDELFIDEHTQLVFK